MARASVCCEVHARSGNDVHHRDVGQVIACTGSGGASSSTPLFCGHNDRTRTVARVAAACGAPQSLHAPHAVVVPLGACVWFECRVCLCQDSTAEDFIAHVLNAYKGKGKRVAR